MQKLARIAYNSADWHHPTGEARTQEPKGSYTWKYGFGHEEWIFRTEWQIAGWCYAFLQGVNRSYASLAKANEPLDVTLYTIDPQQRRRWVATITEVEVLSDDQAEEALAAFKERGWFDTMRAEVIRARGVVAALDQPSGPKHLLNVRFRQTNVQRFAPGQYMSPDDPRFGWHRYQLYRLTPPASPPVIPPAASPVAKPPQGTTSLPHGGTYHHSGTAPTECSLEHQAMQRVLMQQLQLEYHKRVSREKHHVDVSVETDTELLLFEIKSDQLPRTVIRLALGQLLEYALHPARQFPNPKGRKLRLIIVGREPLSRKDQQYLQHLVVQHRLPLEYRVVKLA